MDSTLAHHLQREQGHLQGLGLHGLVLFSGDQVEQKVQVHWNYTIISDFIYNFFSLGHMKPQTRLGVNLRYQKVKLLINSLH